MEDQYDQCDEYEQYYEYMKSALSESVTHKPSQQNCCISCGSDSMISDNENGTVVCTSCGVVNVIDIIDDTPEWTFGQEDAVYGKDPSRCGCPINPLLEKSSMSTIIKGGGQKCWLMKKIHQQNSMDYVERARWHIFEQICRWCENGNLANNVANQAKAYYKELSEKKLSRGGVRQGLIACCIMYACKYCNISRSVKEIADMCEIDSTKINTASKLFEEIMHDVLPKEPITYTCSNDLIMRYCYCLPLDSHVQFDLAKEAEIISKKAECLFMGKTPSATTSAIVLYASEKLDLGITKKDIVAYHKISQVTLQKLYKMLKDSDI